MVFSCLPSTTAADSMVKELVGDDNDSVGRGLGVVAARRTTPG